MIRRPWRPWDERRGYCHGAPPPVQLDCLHVSYELRPADLSPDLGLPELRLAGPGDLDQVEDASAAMLLEDLGRRDREEDPAFFRRRIRHAIRVEEVYIARHRQELAFKVNLGARAHGVIQLQGVYTVEAHRGRGLGRRGCAEVCRRLFDAGTRVVTLFVREENRSARRAYEAVGFRSRGVIRMIILARTSRERR
jgi:predicted GNAT family acetyltransferase